MYNFPGLLRLLEPGHVPALVDEFQSRILNQPLSFQNVCFSGEVLSSLKEEHRRSDSLQFRAQVKRSLRFQECRYDTRIKFIGSELHLKSYRRLPVDKVSRRRGPSPLELGALKVSRVP